ncbi:MAG: glutamate 5-kinase [Bacteroidetes bacterium]|nr:glutamate 5-kinase [Bacteroidota bacterium]
MNRLKKIIDQQTTLVIKVGTHLLANKEKGINNQFLDKLAQNIAELRSKGVRVALVTSGAIGAGVAALGLSKRPTSIPEKQATAAVGQPLLMEAYEHAFRTRQMQVAQILLTKDDFTVRRRYVNAKNTFQALFDFGVIPIINENDTVAVEEIKLGDNDNLSAMVATLIDATMLILLSDIDGLYDSDPHINQSAKLIHIVETITPEIEQLANKGINELSTGGMVTKIQAAKRCVQAGIAMIIANGKDPSILQSIVAGTFRGTIFLPSEKKMTQRKQWIALISRPSGSIIVDDGAQQALTALKKSLLPSGIISTNGKFNVRDIVLIYDRNGNLIGKGISNFSSDEVQLIKGKKSREMEAILKRKAPAEVIHRNNLVVIGD